MKGERDIRSSKIRREIQELGEKRKKKQKKKQ